MTKTTFDSLGRPIVSYKRCDLGETTYAEASSVADDVILEQTETIYDHASNAIQTTTRQRYHTAPDSQTGPLQNTSTTPKARVTYQTMYPDALGRTVATVKHGTHGGTSLSRPATIPRGRKSVRLDSLVRRGDRLLLIDGKPEGRFALAEIMACDVENRRFPGPVSHTRSFQRRRESSECILKNLAETRKGLGSRLLGNNEAPNSCLTSKRQWPWHDRNSVLKRAFRCR